MELDFNDILNGGTGSTTNKPSNNNNNSDLKLTKT